jgi:hypothetical protein
MSHQWIIRVLGKEYGPVDFETLQEWKREGRLIPENPARADNDDLWSTAAEIPDLFDQPAVPPAAAQSIDVPRRSLAGILAETFRIYRKSFFSFVCLALLVVFPSACAQLANRWIDTTPTANVDLRSLAAGAFAFCMFVLSIVLWPIYIAAIQIISAETCGGRPIGFLSALNEAVRYWPRVAMLCIFVYGVFFLLIVFALAILIMILTGGSSPLVIFFALALLAIQVWMFGRFFINVLFWQQFAVLENAGVADSLRESKNLASAALDLPWYRRPWWRGGILVSIWIAFALALTLGPQWSTLREYFNQVLTVQDSQLLLQKLSAAEQARGFNGLGFALGILQKLLQPLLGIAFVVLYFESKRDHEPSDG